MVEASVGSLIFVVLLFFLLDLCRWFYAYIGLNFAAQAGLDLAMKIPIEVYTQADRCNAAHDSGCSQYVARVNEILRTVEDKARLFAGLPDQHGMVRLRLFNHYDPAMYGAAPLSSGIPANAIQRDGRPYGAAFLRPGEAVLRADGTELDHPTRRFGVEEGEGWPSGIHETWSGVFDREPLVVALEADFDTITPFMPSLTVRVRQYGYRKARAFDRAVRTPPGGGPSAGDPPPPPTAAPTPNCSCCLDSCADQPQCPRCLTPGR